jgi:acyl-CoA synthetase (AMP-forming)/AMP-acid ligase II
MKNLLATLNATLERRAAAVALESPGVHLHFADLRRWADAVAGVLAEAGVRPGDRVAVGLPNSPELVACVLGVLRCRAVLVPLNPLYTVDELHYVLDDSGARAAFLHADHAAAVAAADLATLACPAVPAADAVVAAAAPTAAIDDADPALIVYTSGTTGRPKGVVLSHGALGTNLLTVAEAWAWCVEDRLLLTLPCFHLHGLGLGLLTSMMVGSCIVLRDRFDATTVLADLAASRATTFFGVPTMYNRIVALPDGAETAIDLSRMRLWVSGSAPLSAATFERFRDRFGAEIIERYGMTECAFVLSSTPAGPRRAGSVGRVLPGVECVLADADAAEAGRIVAVAPGEVGEILVRGPNLFSGYWQRPDATGAAMLQGFLRSGDLAFIDSEGMFRIVGRKSIDIIKTRGFKVGAGEVEDCLLRHPAVAEAAVVGVPDPDQGQRLVAAVTLRTGADASPEDLRAHARAQLAPHKVPSRIVLIDDIPKTGPGKFRKVELARLLGGSGEEP